MESGWYINNFNKPYHSVVDDIGGGYAYAGAEDIRELSILAVQFCYEPKRLEK